MPSPIMLVVVGSQAGSLNILFVEIHFQIFILIIIKLWILKSLIDTRIHPEKKWIIGVRISSFARSFWQLPKGHSLDGYRLTATILVLRAHEHDSLSLLFTCQLLLSCHTHISIIFGLTIVPFNYMMLSYMGTCMQLSKPQIAIDDKNNN